jgi:hypothetical protein
MRLPAIRLGLTATAAAVVLILAVLLWPRPQAPDLALAVAQDHQEFLNGKFAPDFTGLLPESVARRLDARLDAAAFARLPAEHRFAVKGSRLCFLRGVPAAWTLGYLANAPVSFIVLNQSQLDHFPQMKQRFQSGDSIICADTGGYHFAARLIGQHIVCAIAAVSKSTVEDLVKSVPTTM